MSQPPVSLGRFSGRRPLRTVSHCTGQVATDPQSPREVVSGPAQLGVPTPRLLGFTERWHLGLFLFGLPAREIRVNPLL